jgi:hypothetical protein
MEEYDGVTMLASNRALKQIADFEIRIPIMRRDLDDAFVRRFHFIPFV